MVREDLRRSGVGVICCSLCTGMSRQEVASAQLGREREEFTEQVKLSVLQLGVRSVTSEMSDACTACESIACAVTCTKTCTDPSRKDRSKEFVNHLRV